MATGNVDCCGLVNAVCLSINVCVWHISYIKQFNLTSVLMKEGQDGQMKNVQGAFCCCGPALAGLRMRVSLTDMLSTFGLVSDGWCSYFTMQYGHIDTS